MLTVLYVAGALATIHLVAQILGVALRRIRQPAVLGPLLAGVVLAPPCSVLSNRLATTSRSGRTLGKRSRQSGSWASMLVVALELDVRAAAARRRGVVSIACASVAVPFILGLVAAVPLHERHPTADGSAVDLAPFALFIGTAMSITAVPVLAAIVRERGLQRTQLGALVLACAVTGDAAGWALLAVTLAVLESAGPGGVGRDSRSNAPASRRGALVVRPLILAPMAARHHQRGGFCRRDAALLLAVGLLTGAATRAIGLHAVLGAFVIGAAMPRGDRGAGEAAALALRPAVLVATPVAFAVPGLTLDVSGFDFAAAIELCGVLAIAFAGKLGGVTIAAVGRGSRCTTRPRSGS